MARRAEPTEKELRKLEKTLEDERKEVAEIEQEIHLLEEKLFEKRPSHFSKRDVVNALFASLILGFTIILKGRVLEIAKALTPTHILAIVATTCVILYAEIYYIGYTRIKPEEHRRLGQFVAKRFTTFYGVAIAVSFGLAYLLGIDQSLAFKDVLKLVVLVSMPCAAGAAIPSMLKQF